MVEWCRHDRVVIADSEISSIMMLTLDETRMGVGMPCHAMPCHAMIRADGLTHDALPSSSCLTRHFWMR
jgi:hypothetical protein